MLLPAGSLVPAGWNRKVGFFDPLKAAARGACPVARSAGQEALLPAGQGLTDLSNRPYGSKHADRRFRKVGNLFEC